MGRVGFTTSAGLAGKGNEMRDTDLEWKWTLACVAVMAIGFLSGCAMLVRI